MDNTDNTQMSLIADSFVHEIKTPLTTIKLFAELITTATDLSKVNTNAQKIDRKIDDITRIINYYRDLTKLHSRALSLNDQTVPVNKLVSQTLSSLMGEFPLLTFDQAGVTPQSLTLDSDRFIQLVTIIVDRIVYYHTSTTTIYTQLWGLPSQVIFYFSDQPYSALEEPHPLPVSSMDLNNPSTGLYYALSLLDHYQGKYQFTKSSEGSLSFIFSLPATK